MKLRVLDIARAARAKGPQSQEKLKRAYGKLLTSTSRVVGQAKRFAKEVAEGVKRSSDLMAQLALEALRAAKLCRESFGSCGAGIETANPLSTTW